MYFKILAKRIWIPSTPKELTRDGLGQIHRDTDCCTRAYRTASLRREMMMLCEKTKKKERSTNLFGNKICSGRKV